MSFRKDHNRQGSKIFLWISVMFPFYTDRIIFVLLSIWGISAFDNYMLISKYNQWSKPFMLSKKGSHSYCLHRIGKKIESWGSHVGCKRKDMTFPSGQPDARGCSVLQIEVQGKQRQMRVHVITDRRDAFHASGLKHSAASTSGLLITMCWVYIDF